ncbi:MAG TPA: NnrS family protein [Methylophilaceae bacterium]|nr:NnrS family protein [Methylophilaceae bacterium]
MAISEQPSQPASRFALWNLGFRPFFLFAGILAVVSMALWMHIYTFNLPFATTGISVYQWHAHEMIYGFSVAVIAGFLLTAVQNWTGRPTASGKALIGLVLLWAVARVAMMFGDRFIAIAGVFDMLFMLGLMIAVAMPIVEAKQWKQLGVLSKLVLLMLGNLSFYLGALGMLLPGTYWGIYGGLLLVIGLILTITRRVVPFFIERGVGYEVQLYNAKWLDIVSFVLFALFFVAELFLALPGLVFVLAGALFIVTSVRLYGWHTAGIWKKPLLWSLFVALLFIDLGFLMFAINIVIDVPRLLAIHAFAVGGIGLITLAMMSRVSLGHTGRDIGNPPLVVSIACLCLIAAALFRVVVPLFAMDQYPMWIMISQILWMIAFTLFVIRYLPILIRPRADGRPG